MKRTDDERIAQQRAKLAEDKKRLRLLERQKGERLLKVKRQRLWALARVMDECGLSEMEPERLRQYLLDWSDAPTRSRPDPSGGGKHDTAFLCEK